MNAMQAVMDRPADFIIKTPSSYKYFLLKIRRGRHRYKPSNALKLCLKFASKLQIGSCDIILPDYTKLHFAGKESGPHGVLFIHNDSCARKLLTGGRLGWCEAYLDGDWSSPDIARFFTMIMENAEVMRKTLHGKGWYRALSGFLHSFKSNSKKQARQNIYAHYDIGNAFYKAWLDPSMTYSSALFRTGEETLEQAQHEKYKNLAEMLDIQPEHSVLEIGCGWGGFAEYVATEIGAHMTCITISQEQYEYAVQRMEDKGLSDKVNIVLQDYRDLTGQFDRIASIEMFEAVGEQYWPTYFGQIKNLLKPRGKAGLQIITIHDSHFDQYRRSADYIQRYIFPGGMLPSEKALAAQTDKAGLAWGNIVRFGQDYSKTLALWDEAFQKEWPRLKEEQGFDDRFKRLWEQYLAYCQAGFNVGTIDVVQLVLGNEHT